MVLKSDILTPIQTGCANTERLFDGMLHDDDGENISAENPKYNECPLNIGLGKITINWENPIISALCATAGIFALLKK